jgi:hypothetical protein
MSKYTILFCYLGCLLLFFLDIIESQVISKSSSIILSDDIVWLDSQIALVLGRINSTDNSNKLFRTIDGGFTWNDITDKLDTANKDPPIVGSPIYASRSFPTRVYIVGSGNYNWGTIDKGETWSAYERKFFYLHIKWHPTQPNWALAITPQYTIFFTNNAGYSWVKVRELVIEFSWGDAGLGSVPETRIYMTTYTQENEIPFDFKATDNFGTSEFLIQAHSYQFLFLSKQLFSMVFLPTVGKSVLKASPDVGIDFKILRDSNFPFGDSLPNNGYAILDDSTGAVYMGVNHGDFLNSHWGNVYVSDSAGIKYSLSLQHASQLTSNSNSQVSVSYDFDIIHSVEGVYMGNVLLNWQSSTGSRDYDELETFITFNNGGSWKLLQHPHFDSNGFPITCSSCSLHLAGKTSFGDTQFSPLYSVNSAVGLILGTGNVGTSLKKANSEINTYLSRDAGLTWRELRKGSSIYQVGDHGGIIVLAPIDPTNIIYYTLDFGLTPLISFQFTDSPVSIKKILVEPSSRGNKFILVIEEYMLFGLDFSNVFTRNCTSEDYELWAPENNENGCLMGRNVVYQRRNASSLCFNDEKLEPIAHQSNCACTLDDYECDFNYERANATEPCLLIPGDPDPIYPPSICPEGSTYYETKGYRLEPGNSCEGGVDLRPKGPYECPTSFSVIKGNKGWIAAVVVIPLVIILIVASFFAIRNEKIRNKLPFLKLLSTWKIGYFGIQQPELNLVDGPDSAEEENATEFSDTFHKDNIEDNTSQIITSKSPAIIDDDSDDFNPRK